jgi:hypothetical protein
MQEQWRPVVGYEHWYEVSNLGQLRSTSVHIRGLSRAGNEVFRLRNGRILKQGIQNSGYLQVVLSANNISKKLLVHRVVGEAFIPNPSQLPEINHLDSNKLNNTASNLEWCTRQQNFDHARLAGKVRFAKGEETGFAKLTDDKVRQIRLLLAQGKTNLEISRLYGVSAPIISYVKTGKTWRHVI